MVPYTLANRLNIYHLGLKDRKSMCKPCSFQWTLSALMSQHKNGGVSVGTFVNFVWVTIGENFLSDHISTKKAGKELKPTGMVIT